MSAWPFLCRIRDSPSFWLGRGLGQPDHSSFPTGMAGTVELGPLTSPHSSEYSVPVAGSVLPFGRSGELLAG